MTEKLSLAEALSVGLSTTVIGLAIVFAVLIILMLVLMAMKYVFAPSNKKTAETTAPVIPTPSVGEKTETDDEELIAIFAAAIAASLNTSTYNLKIKSYRRTDTNANAWQRAGLRETIDNRF